MLHGDPSISSTTSTTTSINALFTYKNISSQKQVCDDDITFGSNIERTAFIKFGYIGIKPQFMPKPQDGKQTFAPGGWKLHISIDDLIPGNVEKAWDTVKDVLIEHYIAMSKVIKPGVSFADDATQSGKQITIYQFFNSNRNWEAIINEIELRLISAKISPAKFSPTDKQIAGSNYFTYRNDLSEDGEHAIISTVAMHSECPYNPFGRKPDPFEDIVIKQGSMLQKSL